MNFFNRYYWLCLIGSVLYLITSYLVLLRDAFLLERISITLGNPTFESIGLEVSRTLKVNGVSIIFLALTLVSLFAGYLGLVYKRKSLNLTIRQFSIFTALLVFLMLLSFPSFSTDVFDYNNVNRVAYLHNSNPWIYPANHFANDSEIYYGSWITRATVYPPLAFVATSMVYLIFGANPLIAALGFKLLCVCFYLLILKIIYHQSPKSDKVSSLVIFAWNPLILIEFIGNGHNDLLLGLCVLLFVIWIQSHRYIKSGLALGLGFLSKFTIVIPGAVAVYWLVKKQNWPALRAIVITSVCVIMLGLLPLGEGNSHLFNNFMMQTSIYERSLPGIFRYGILWILGGSEQINSANLIQKIIMIPTLIMVLSSICLRISKNNLPEIIVLTMGGYLLIGAPMLQPWYLAWVFPVVSLIKNKSVYQASLIASASLMTTYLIRYVSLYLHPDYFGWQIVMYLVIVMPILLSLAKDHPWCTHFTSYQKSS